MKRYYLIGFALCSIVFFLSRSATTVFAVTPTLTPKPTPTSTPKPTPTSTPKPTPTKSPLPTAQPTKGPLPTIPAVINPVVTPAPPPSIVVKVIAIFKSTVKKIEAKIVNIFYRPRPVKKKQTKNVIKQVSKKSNAFWYPPKVIKKPIILNQ